jgi:hypothetical protein
MAIRIKTLFGDNGLTLSGAPVAIDDVKVVKAMTPPMLLADMVASALHAPSRYSGRRIFGRSVSSPRVAAGGDYPL